MTRMLFAALSLGITFSTALGQDKLPRVLDKRLKIELFAENPQINTPTGIDVDQKGQVWAIESNTHFPPEGYAGRPTDRVLVMQDTNGDHRADKITVFTDGLTHTMSVAVKPLWLEGRESRVESQEKKSKAHGLRPVGTTDVYIATRRAIWIFSDVRGDLKSDRKKLIIWLETKGDYPHNGLAGFAFDAMGWMYFGFGENLGADYNIVGSDGTTLSGGGEGGNLYRCRPDGSKLTQWATGFWNPHASCVDAFGRLFTVDNDPDSRPPCRLLHIIEGGDYGFRFSNGRKGLHPFTAWNGEIPGTLPMVAGTGEAPSGIVAYESDGLPEDYIGDLLVTSWGDHRIDRFRLKEKGASFESLAEPIVQGGENFRPVGIAVAPDGSLYCTDWVLRDYKIHGRGRVWRISMRTETEPGSVNPDRAHRARLSGKVIDAAAITEKTPIAELKGLLKSKRLDVRRMAANTLTKSPSGRKELLAVVGNEKESARKRIEALWSLAKVPVDVHDFDFMRLQNGPARIACRYDAVGVAAYSLLGTPQFPLKSPYRFLLDEKDDFLKTRSEESIDFTLSYDKLLRIPELRRVVLAELRLARLSEFDEFFYIVAIDSRDAFLLSELIRSAAKHGAAPTTPAEWKQYEDLAVFSGGLVTDGQKHADVSHYRLAWLLTARRQNPGSTAIVEIGLKDPAPPVRRAAVQWVAEEGLKDLRPQVEAILNDTKKPMTTDLFLAALAALEMLDGVDPKNFDNTPAAKYVLPLLKDEKRPPAVRAQALRLVDSADPALTGDVYRKLLAVDDAQLKLETVRTMQFSPLKEAEGLLAAVAKDEQHEVHLRAEALMGLAHVAARHEVSERTLDLLAASMLESNQVLKIEGIRVLRGFRQTSDRLLGAYVQVAAKFEKMKADSEQRRELADLLALNLLAAGESVPDDLQKQRWQRPGDTAAWYELLKKRGNLQSGRRIFFHPHGPGCYKCHTVNGRGSNVGPDLSTIGRAANRKKLAESIIEPSRDIAPQFTNFTFVMESGQVHTGMILGDTRDNIQQIGTPEGKVVELATDKIESRTPQKTSVMPEKLAERMTVSEFRDLLSFLESLK